MSATIETPDVQQMEAHGYFTEWFAETTREDQAEATSIEAPEREIEIEES